MIVQPIHNIKIKPGEFVLIIGNMIAANEAARILGFRDNPQRKLRHIRVQEATQVSGKFNKDHPPVRVLVHEHTASLSAEQQQAIGFCMAHSATLEYFTL